MDRINYRENLSKENTIAAVKVPKVFVSLLHNKKKKVLFSRCELYLHRPSPFFMKKKKGINV